MGECLIVMRNWNSESLSGGSAKPDPAVSIQVFRAAKRARMPVIYTYSPPFGWYRQVPRDDVTIQNHRLCFPNQPVNKADPMITSLIFFIMLDLIAQTSTCGLTNQKMPLPLLRAYGG